jgi:hypothetical protein
VCILSICSSSSLQFKPLMNPSGITDIPPPRNAGWHLKKMFKSQNLHTEKVALTIIETGASRWIISLSFSFFIRYAVFVSLLMTLFLFGCPFLVICRAQLSRIVT